MDLLIHSVVKPYPTVSEITSNYNILSEKLFHSLKLVIAREVGQQEVGGNQACEWRNFTPSVQNLAEPSDIQTVATLRVVSAKKYARKLLLQR